MSVVLPLWKFSPSASSRFVTDSARALIAAIHDGVTYPVEVCTIQVFS